MVVDEEELLGHFPHPAPLSSSSSLRVTKSPPAPSSTFSAGLAGRRGWRDGDRPLYRFVVRLLLGYMPVVWRRISNLFGQIGGCIGCSARFLQLRWPEMNQSTFAIVSINKAALAELSLLEQAPGSSLVGRGGRRRRKGASASLAVLWPTMVAGGRRGDAVCCTSASTRRS
jgi:hypothetical protein